MGRPEGPVDRTVPELGRLADHLRDMRRRAGWTYEQLAERAGYSASHLKRAADGRRLPDRFVVQAYARACLVDDRVYRDWFRARDLHTEAAEAIARAQRAGRLPTVTPKPQFVRDCADLSGALRDAWTRAARPTARAMEAASNGLLPRSTANVIANGHSVPRALRQYLAFLEVCGISGRARVPWLRAWVKVRGTPTQKELDGTLAWMDHGLAAAFLDVVAERLRETRDGSVPPGPGNVAAVVTRRFTELQDVLAERARKLREAERRVLMLEVVVGLRAPGTTQRTSRPKPTRALRRRPESSSACPP
ncbi:helix-turn-helix transcriptional regulator [Streptomyces longwoodensis]|uniref:helix-turn-helix domain-containing protein n=1 Tax=Streptomyces longwoodensis TaxID=68231 RepID=UPI003250E61A